MRIRSFDPLEILAPRMCLGCHRLATIALCQACLFELERLPQDGCKTCGNPRVQTDCLDCDWCRGLRFKPVSLISLFSYRGLGRDIYHQVKFGGYWRLLESLIAAALPQIWQTTVLRDCDVIVPIPASPKQRLRRLFNPPTEMAHHLSYVSGIPVNSILSSRLFSKKQTGLDRKQRQRNARGKFRARKTNPSTVLLVDDVLTTGATLEAASKVLTKAGVAEIHWLTLFRRI